MTAPRSLARAGRSRFFIGIGALILMIGFVAIFQSSQTQLDEFRQQAIRCEQQQENLNARVQAIIEHKFRLEKSLESERKDHSETRTGCETKLKEQKDLNGKSVLDLNVRYDTLQQHYKLLQSEHSDLVDECSRTKKSQAEQINGLTGKVKSLQSQLQTTKSQQEKQLDEWKTKYDHLVREKDRLEILLKTSTSSNDNSLDKCKTHASQLQSILQEYKSHCDFKPQNVPIDNDALSIPLPQAQPSHNKEESSHPLDKPTIQKSFKEQQPIAPKPLLSSDDQRSNNDADNVQHAPPHKLSSSTQASDLKGKSDESNKRALPFASPLSSSTASEKMKRSSTAASNRADEVAGRLKSKQIELGVAPVPDNFDDLLKNEESHGNGQERPEKEENADKNDNNRYSNVVNELVGKNADVVGEQDNAANEVRDDFNLGAANDGKDHLQEVLDNINNAAEDDTNNNNFFDAKFGHKKDHGGELEDEDVEVVGRKHEKHAGDRGDGHVDGFVDGGDLNNEVDGDQGKDNDMRLEEPNEEDEDEDDYSIHAPKQEGVAIRN